MTRNKRPVLLIDMDGVIADYYGLFLSTWKQQYPSRPVIETKDLKMWAMEDMYDAKYTKDIRRITTSKGFFENLPPIPGAIEALKTILIEGTFDPFLCSTPDSHTEEHCCPTEKFKWIEKYLGREWVKRTILTNDKTLVYGDLLIDDKPDIKGVNNPYWTQIFFTTGYNKDLPGPRINNWNDPNYISKRLLTILENT